MARKDKGKIKKDLTSKRSGRLVVLGFSHWDKNGHGSVWECKCDCGKVIKTRGSHITAQKTQSCGCFRKEMFDKWRKDKCGSKNVAYKGGRININGYIKVLIPFKDRALGDPRYILEHRKVVEDSLCRKLTINESVHHKNGIKTDNRLENLQLVTKNTHLGDVECPYCKNHFFIR